MKTVIIYDQLEANLTFGVVDEDLTRLDGVYINQCPPDEDDEDTWAALEAKQDELSNLLYDSATGQNTPLLNSFTDTFPVEAVREGAAVIVCGFLP